MKKMYSIGVFLVTNLVTKEAINFHPENAKNTLLYIKVYSVTDLVTGE